MKSKKEVYKFLESLQWERFTKKELEKCLQNFFGVKNKMEDFTDVSAPKDIDWSFGFTNETDSSTNHLIDIEIWYAKTRGGIIVTGTELLEYID